MAHVIQLALRTFICSLGVKGHNKSWKSHVPAQQFGENKSSDIGKRQRLRNEGNASMNEVSALRPGLARIIEKVRISRHTKWPDNAHHIAENAWGIDYTDTWSSKQAHWLS